MDRGPSQLVIITGGSGFIGTNLVAHFVRAGWTVLNVDRLPPRNPSDHEYWRQCDLLDAAKLRASFKDFSPSLVLHMGARTDLDGRSLGDYAANTAGVEN